MWEGALHDHEDQEAEVILKAGYQRKCSLLLSCFVQKEFPRAAFPCRLAEMKQLSGPLGTHMLKVVGPPSAWVLNDYMEESTLLTRLPVEH